MKGVREDNTREGLAGDSFISLNEVNRMHYPPGPKDRAATRQVDSDCVLLILVKESGRK